ncbi:hypothetical protein C9374_012249 [Naegleria lovaniensis]|uniref:Uncharacterized protein n=1 Tax=Naegleria lovaniensis TaxID=51637 RepID=A0AA88KCL1_NAELO|nr:uncharacterized protein C9374_012249 [Naegleria lovaniensis]KAG2373383.1 hypothetical protein C9374_012249 [Naegleria lovaniensis]
MSSDDKLLESLAKYEHLFKHQTTLDTNDGRAFAVDWVDNGTIYETYFWVEREGNDMEFKLSRRKAIGKVSSCTLTQIFSVYSINSEVDQFKKGHRIRSHFYSNSYGLLLNTAKDNSTIEVLDDCGQVQTMKVTPEIREFIPLKSILKKSKSSEWKLANYTFQDIQGRTFHGKIVQPERCRLRIEYQIGQDIRTNWISIGQFIKIEPLEKIKNLEIESIGHSSSGVDIEQSTSAEQVRERMGQEGNQLKLKECAQILASLSKFKTEMAGWLFPEEHSLLKSFEQSLDQFRGLVQTTNTNEPSCEMLMTMLTLLEKEISQSYQQCYESAKQKLNSIGEQLGVPFYKSDTQNRLKRIEDAYVKLNNKFVEVTKSFTTRVQTIAELNQQLLTIQHNQELKKLVKKHEKKKSKLLTKWNETCSRHQSTMNALEKKNFQN